jgi:glycosyltransferase involved in cell wall biosynthesis
MAISDEQTRTGASTDTKAGGKPRLVSFVLPVYNEESTLKELHARINDVMAGLVDDHELVFVDDGSTDRSFAVLSELNRRDARVRVVQLRRNFGKSAAYSAGFDNARGDVVITMDTDLQDDPAEIPLFLEQLDRNHDMVIGWKHEGKGPLGKRIPSKLFNRIVMFITGIPLHDFNCPFKAYRRQVLQEIQVYGELHRFIPVLASARGFSLGEVKIRNLPRRAGKSKFGMERYLRGMLDLLTISFITRFAKRPMHLLGTGGILACLVGFGTIAFFVVAHFLYKLNLLIDDSWNIHDRPAISLGILLMVVGIQFFSLGLLGELLIARHGSATGDRGYSVKRILEE